MPQKTPTGRRPVVRPSLLFPRAVCPVHAEPVHEREPFENPLKPADRAHKKYEGRTVYRAYKRKTDWIELLGFAMPKDKATRTANTVPLGSVGGVSESFEPGEGAGADALLVTRAGHQRRRTGHQ